MTRSHIISTWEDIFPYFHIAPHEIDHSTRMLRIPETHAQWVAKCEWKTRVFILFYYVPTQLLLLYTYTH